MVPKGATDKTPPARQEAALRHVLQQHFPRDVLMPCHPSTKRPMFPHKYGFWTWEKYHDSCIKREQREQNSGQRQDPGVNLSVALTDLCVVDVDGGPANVAAFEQENAQHLTGAPRVDTARGRHYWFVRPAVADELGYFDGPAQRARGVDFKSVCRSGTSGICCVPPSSGKAWATTPGSTPIHEGPPRPSPRGASVAATGAQLPLNGGNVPQMPLALLDRVARRSYRVPTSTPVMLRFEGDVICSVCACAHLQRMAYFEPFFGSDEDNGIGEQGSSGVHHGGSDEASVVPVIPVPCAADAFFELLHVLEHGALSGALEPDQDLLVRLADLARLLGCARQEEVVRLIAGGVPRAQAAAREMFPEWWRAHVIERAERDMDLVDLDDHEVEHGRLVYEPVQLPPRLRENMLLPTLSQSYREGYVTCRPRAFGTKAPLLPPEGATRALERDGRIDERVLAAMKEFPGHVVLGGGAVLDALVPADTYDKWGSWVNTDKPADYDLFIVGVEDATACTDMLCRIKEIVLGPGGSPDHRGLRRLRQQYQHNKHGGRGRGRGREGGCSVRTGCAHTFLVDRGRGGDEGELVVQVVLRRYRNVAQVLSSFDVGPCKVAAMYGPYDGTRTHSGVEEEGGPRLRVVCAPTWVPCMRRMAFPIDLGRWSVAGKLRAFKYLCKGFEVYLPGVCRQEAARNMSLSVRHPLSAIGMLRSESEICHGRFWPTLNADVLQRIGVTASSDYGEFKKTRKSLKHALMGILRHGYSWLQAFPVHVQDLRRRGEDAHTDALDEALDRRETPHWPAYSPRQPVMRPTPSMWHLVSARPGPEFAPL